MPGSAKISPIESAPTDMSRGAPAGAPALEPLLLTVNQTCEMIGFGRTKIYALVGEGRLEAVSIPLQMTCSMRLRTCSASAATP